jgi:hypothetical protein
MNIRSHKNLGATMLALILSACGGGGSSTPPAPTITTTAEGVYVGTISNGNSFDGIVLEDGSYYVLSGPLTAAGLTVSGFAQGSGTSNNGSFTSTNLINYLATGAVVLGSVSASYNTNTLSGTVTGGGIANTFSGAKPANTSYVYNIPANLANITGAWTLADMKGGNIAMTISPTGSFTGTGTSGCIFSGTLTPRASGKNVFNFAATFGAAPCALPGQTFSGIAVDYLLANGTRQLVAAGVDAGRGTGTSVFGVR